MFGCETSGGRLCWLRCCQPHRRSKTGTIFFYGLVIKGVASPPPRHIVPPTQVRWGGLANDPPSPQPSARARFGATTATNVNGRRIVRNMSEICVPTAAYRRETSRNVCEMCVVVCVTLAKRAAKPAKRPRIVCEACCETRETSAKRGAKHAKHPAKRSRFCVTSWLRLDLQQGAEHGVRGQSRPRTEDDTSVLRRHCDY